MKLKEAFCRISFCRVGQASGADLQEMGSERALFVVERK